MKRLTALLAAVVATAALPAAARAVEPPCESKPRTACYGLASADASLSTSGTQAGFEPTQAGAHPDLHLNFALKEDPESAPNAEGLRAAYAKTRDVVTELAPGMVGDPNALGHSQQCAPADLINFEAVGCPNGSQVGLTRIYLSEFVQPFCEPIYMMKPPGGDVVARFGFVAGVFPTFINVRVRSQSDYGLTAEISDVSSAATLVKAENVFWGVPADHVHDNERPPRPFLNTECESAARPPGSEPLPLLTNPTRCGPAGDVRVSTDSWDEPGIFGPGRELDAPLGEFVGCDGLPFNPSLQATPTSAQAGAPTGLDLTIKLPRAEGVSVLEPSQMRALRIAFPAGMTLDPDAADGLTSCSPEQVGYHVEPVGEAHCPPASKLAAAEFEVTGLERRMKGAIYLRTPEPGDPYRIWIVADDLGAHIKLPGELHVDRTTGQIESIVTEAPQVGTREVKLNLKSGFRAPLVNPVSCGTYVTRSVFTPWSGNPPVSVESPMRIDEGCEGLGGFAPKLIAGTTNTQAGAYTPFTFDLARQDGEQNPRTLDVSLPPGLTGKLSGLPLCQEPGAARGECPAASQIGHVLVATGPGPAPLWVPQPGKAPTAVYWGGPYEGAPFSLIVVVPAQAGPFDFGDVVVRSAVRIDPTTAQVSVSSDPLPQIIEGIPLSYRHIRVQVDKPQFILEPTNCEPAAVTGSVRSASGASAAVSTPFHAADCGKLAFKPSFTVSTAGKTSRKSGASLHVKLAYPKAPQGTQANIKYVKVDLPRQLPSRLETLQKACTDKVFDVNPANCPAASRIGAATATTPILPVPLTGPVYFVSHAAVKFPDLVIVLQGYGVAIDLRGETFIAKNGQTSTTFRAIPDEPVGVFELDLPQGPFSALAAPTGVCNTTKTVLVSKRVKAHGRTVTRKVRKSVAAPLVMPTRMIAQNGAVFSQSTQIKTVGCPKVKPKKKGKRKK